MTRREFIIRKSTSALIATAFCAAAVSVAAAQASPAAPMAASFSSSTAEVGNSLRLVVGRSMFVNSAERLRRVYVSNPEVLDSMTSTPHQIVVTAKSAGTSTLVLWDETGGSQAYQVTTDVDVDAFRSALKDAMPAENIRVEGREDQIGLAGTVSSQAVADQALKLADLFSKNVASSLVIAPQHTPQVRLKVRVVEIDRTKAQELGFNFFSTGKNTANESSGLFSGISVGQSTSPSETTSTNANVSSLLGLQSLLSLFYYNSAIGLGADIQDRKSVV